MRGEAEVPHGFLDATLIVEVRDARPLVRRSHGCVDIVFNAGLARQRRKTLTLHLFPLDARRKRRPMRLAIAKCRFERGQL